MQARGVYEYAHSIIIRKFFLLNERYCKIKISRIKFALNDLETLDLRR